MAYEITKSFVFDAAHQLAANVQPGHLYAGLHGHSFDCELTFRGTPDARTGWIRDFAELQAICDSLRDQLDHKYLNEIPGLERPTLERICAWIWDKVAAQAPELIRVRVHRGSFREGCTYTGPDV